MKKEKIKYLIIIISIAVAGKVYSQQGWEYVNPYPTGQTIYSMSFINANTGMAVTTDGSTVLFTTNSGNNWISHVPFDPFNFGYFGCLMIDENTGLIGSVTDYSPVGIFKTTDKGKNWQEVFNTGNPGGVDNFYRYGDNTIYATYRYSYLKSTDRGNTWSMKEVTSYPHYLNSILFINDNIGFICGQDDLILKTTNNGENWFNLNVNFGGNFDCKDVMFKNENTGLVVSSIHGSYRTTNGGINWTHYPNQNGGAALDRKSVV